MRGRDNQRQRLYNAQHRTCWTTEPSKYAKVLFEDMVTYYSFEKKQAPSLEACQSYYDAIIKRAWFQNRWKYHSVNVIRGNGATASGRTIRLAYWARKEWVLLHELAHTLTPSRYAAHGREFAGILLFLVQQVMGKAEADKLREQFKAHKVRYNYSCVPPVKKKMKMLA